MTRRPLTSLDASQLEEFLASHCDSSMFLRSNIRRAGIDYGGEPFQAIYLASFRDDGSMIAVAAHCWNGMLLLQAPQQTAETVRACVEASGRRVTGLMGPLEQAHEARTALGLDDTVAQLDGAEALYALALSELIVPAASTRDGMTCRAPRSDERAALCAWRLAYDIETMGATDTPEHRQRSAAFLDDQIANGNAWVALDAGVLVSLSALNASLPDIVQLGGIYTPPERRGRGYAKAAVAASLVAARERGASRAVLFTKNPNAARTYEAVGFQRVGDYSLIPVSVT